MAGNGKLGFWGWLVLIVLAILTGGYFYRKWKEEQARLAEDAARKAEEAKKDRERRLAFFEGKLAAIRLSIQEFLKITNLDTGYCANFQMQSWMFATQVLVTDIKSQGFKQIGLKKTDEEVIERLIRLYSNSEALREEFNKKVIDYELMRYGVFFDSVEHRKLDLQQRTAIVTNDDNNIVIAGAGSGKTTTIVGKVSYLIDRYKVASTKILLISFTNKSAATLASRINIPGIEAKTFHKFGKDVICSVEGVQPSIFDSEQTGQLFRSFFNELMKQPEYLLKVTSYFYSFLKLPKSMDEFENQGDYVQYLKDQNFTTYQQKPAIVKGRMTLKREVVKSIEECKIANFLLFNGIDYEYERPYEYRTADSDYQQYKPDFTINPSGSRVYLEHFALNKNGEVPKFFAKADKGETHHDATRTYKAGIEWKRGLHNEKKTQLIETFSHEMQDDTLFPKLRKRLTEKGVELKPKSPEEIWKIISEVASDEVDGVVQLLQTFVSLLKSNNYTISDLAAKNKLVKDGFIRKRNEKFLEFVTPVFEKYQRYLQDRQEIDFNDMINKASDYIQSRKFKGQYEYVIIDEFQDISIGRYQLVKAIKTANPQCRLFCVGDDWQSIYRFTGSDISLFKDFQKYFGHTVTSKIETTYRFNKPLLSYSSEFITKNPNQAAKNLKGLNSSGKTTMSICYSTAGTQDDTLALREVFDELLTSDPKIGKKGILILGRYSFDLKRIKNEDRTFAINESTGVFEYVSKDPRFSKIKLQAQFMTVHKAKGLEADIVIVINCNSGKHGFPSGIADDPVLNLLLSEADQFENGEERRLFYVALTRCKERVFLIADSYFKSKFICEMEVETGESKIKKCPRCVTADLVARTGTRPDGSYWSFWGCSNYQYGCDYQEWPRTTRMIDPKSLPS